MKVVSIVVLGLTMAALHVEAAQLPTATIRGVVREGNTPRAGIKILATHLRLETTVEVQTDQEGRFQIANLREGPYEVTASVAGLGAVVTVTVQPGETRQIELVLRSDTPVPPPPSPPAVAPPTVAATVEKTPDFIPSPDRWRLRLPVPRRYPREAGSDYPPVDGRPRDPFNLNTLKGDRPIVGQQTFLVLTGVSESVFEFRKVPTPSGVSAASPGSDTFFGSGTQYTLLPTGVVSAEIFHGDTAFRPRDWALRVTPVFNINYLHTEERGIVEPSPEGGTSRRRTDVALQEAFAELKLFDVGANYDFVSVRAGIQPFTSDFRGFLYRDTNFGVRAFGTWGRNRNQWNVAVFDQLEKETNSDLNLLRRRSQKVFIANYYRQDFFARGYTISPSFHANLDSGEELAFDANGFLVRPSPIGLVLPHRVRAYYAGLGGDGHLGRVNVTHQFYQAFGTDEFNGIAGRPVDIRGRFAAVEASVDRDWLRPKAVFVFASGDDDPDDDRAGGFDAILDNPNIGGGAFSFWNRQGIRLTQTLVTLVGRNSILPTLRSSKTEGQANFVNPGLVMIGGGLDVELTRKARVSINANYLRVHRTQTLERVLFQPSIDAALGLDVNGGVQYRPALNDNVIVTIGASVFKPGLGFQQMLTPSVLYTPFAALTLTY